MQAIKTPTVECDKRTLMIVVVLMAIGASLVASSSSYFSSAKFEDPYFLLKRHLIRILIAAMFLVLAMKIDYRIYRKLAPFVFVVGLGLLIGLFVMGTAIRDTVRWYNIQALQVTIQPAELARLSLIVFLAYWIARKGTDIRDFKRGFLPAAIASLLVIVLIAVQPNYGSATATAIIAFLLLFLGGARIPHLMLVGFGIVAAAGIRVLQVPYVRERMMAFFGQGEGLTAMNWQPYQSLVALGTGGLFGTGFGESRQKLNWLPDSHTDFIFSILGEEAGLVGTMIVSLLFLLLVLRALKISRNVGDTFGEMLVVGIGSSVFVYSMLNMFVTTGLFPVTGLPLPFMSYGGSALVANAFAIGILLNVSKRRFQKTAAERRRPARSEVTACA